MKFIFNNKPCQPMSSTASALVTQSIAAYVSPFLTVYSNNKLMVNTIIRINSHSQHNLNISVGNLACNLNVLVPT